MMTPNSPPSSSGESAGASPASADDLEIPDFLRRGNNRSEVKIKTAPSEWLDKWTASTPYGSYDEARAAIKKASNNPLPPKKKKHVVDTDVVDIKESPDAEPPLGASGHGSKVQHGNAPLPGDPPEQGFEIGTEPSLEEVLKTIARLSEKQANIERLKNKLKDEFINRLWQL